jgi:hypothetical protein
MAKKKKLRDYIREAREKAKAAADRDSTVNEEEMTVGLLVDGVYSESDVRLAFYNPDRSERQLVEDHVRKILSEFTEKPRPEAGKSYL